MLVLTMLFCINAVAGKTDNQVLYKIESDKIKVTTKKGFHLNVESPSSIKFDGESEKNKPQSKTEKLFVFNVRKNASQGEISVYVCDDAKTVCEPHNKEITLAGATKKEFNKKEKNEFNKISEVSLESSNGKPTLLMFSAPWCPACIRMQTETLQQKNVQNQLAQINFLKLNSDEADNYDLSQKFKVRAIPTMILIDKKGTEIFRWLDYQSAVAFEKNLKAEISKIIDAEELAAKAKAGDEASARKLAMRAYNAMDFEGAIKWFLLTRSTMDQNYKVSAEISLAQEQAESDKKLKDEYLYTLQKGIMLTTSDVDRLRWSLDYFESKKEQSPLEEGAIVKVGELIKKIEELYANNKAAKKAFQESTYGNYEGFESEELLWLKSRAQKILAMTTDKEKTDKATIELIKKKKLSEQEPGKFLLAISYLKEAGDTELVNNFYNKLIKKNSNSYVYYEKYARYLKSKKDFEKALAMTEEALKYPQGNEPQLKLLKALILSDMNKKADALEVVNQALTYENITHKRFVGTAKKLSDLKSELSKQE